MIQPRLSSLGKLLDGGVLLPENPGVEGLAPRVQTAILAQHSSSHGSTLPSGEPQQQHALLTVFSTGSQNARCWKGPSKVTESNSPTKAGLA